MQKMRNLNLMNTWLTWGKTLHPYLYFDGLQNVTIHWSRKFHLPNWLFSILPHKQAENNNNISDYDYVPTWSVLECSSRELPGLFLGTNENTPFPQVLTPEFGHSAQLPSTSSPPCTWAINGTWVVGVPTVWTQPYFVSLPRHQCSANKCEHSLRQTSSGKLINLNNYVESW